MITIFTLINSFTYFFFKSRNNFACFISPVVEKLLIHMKRLVAASALFVLSRFIDHTTAQIEVVRKSLYVEASYRRGITMFTQKCICMWACKNGQ